MTAGDGVGGRTVRILLSLFVHWNQKMFSKPKLSQNVPPLITPLVGAAVQATHHG
jgi:hypothetical protein